MAVVGISPTDSLVVSIGLIEKDRNGDVLWTWAYPTMSEVQRNVALRKCGLVPGIVNDDGRQQPQPSHGLVYSHFGKFWLYVTSTEVFEADHLNKVKQFALVLWARDFNPEKYERLCRILSKTYCKSGSAATIVRLYLSVVAHGSCVTNENGTFSVTDYEQRKAFANATIKAVINAFKLETILIYTALILKKRIAVYHHRLDALLTFMRVLPAFVWHRQNWDILYPFVDLNADEIDDLTSQATYAAGFLDASIESRRDLYDVFINLAAIEITVTPNAKDSFAMSKLHKDIALCMVRCAEDDTVSEHETIKEVANKTRDVLNQLCTIAASTTEMSESVNGGAASLDLAKLKDHRTTPALSKFLVNLAVAENMRFV